MARNNKHSKSGGKARYAPRRHNQQNRSDKASGAYSTPHDFQSSTFTLRDAARSSGHPSTWFSTATLNLRHQGMSFVPSSEPFRQELTEPRVPPTQSDLQYSQTHGTQNVEASSATVPSQNELQYSQNNVTPNEGTLRAVPNIDGNESLHADDSIIREPLNALNLSRRSSVSSEGEVVFAGRNHLQTAIPQEATLSSNQNIATVVSDPAALAAQAHDEEAAGVWEDVNDDFDVEINDMRSPTRALPPLSHRSIKRIRKGKKSWQLTISRVPNEEIENVLDDYVDNMRANGELPVEPDLPPQEGAVLKAINNGWTSDNIHDFDDMSTSHEVMEAVEQILSKRERPGGIQYLVVWLGQSIDEARWISSSLLTMPGAAGLIDAFEEEEKRIPEYPQRNISSDDSDNIPVKWHSDSEDSELEDQLDDYLDEEDLIARRMDRMTDEHIARLMQKQESLGIIGDDLQIFDGIDDLDPDSADNPEAPPKQRLSRKKRDQQRRRREREARFEAEEDLLFGGEDYGDFDVMDFERPSLQRGKQRQIDALQGLSDSDMAQNLRETWASDRNKKRAKKQEREELRAQGLLGRPNSKPDLKAKYKDGMNPNKLVDELEDFLCNRQKESLALPPMDKRERKAIHIVAQTFGLKSRSQGSAKQRFTMLFKTSQTYNKYFPDQDSSRLRAALERKVFQTMGGKDSRAIGGARARSKTRVGYRDGDIVGATAPEIAANNRGRAMLEKMGWSSGTALGTTENQGILVPIEHVVKNTRAGLG